MKIDTSLYTGSGGVAFAYYKLAKHFKGTEHGEHYASRFSECLKLNMELVDSGKCRKGYSAPSFLQSAAGLYTTGFLYYTQVEIIEAKANTMIDYILTIYTMLSDPSEAP